MRIALTVAALLALSSCGKKAPVFPNCGDNVTNGEETDVDCGGRICTPCNTGKHCNVATDCRGKLCNSDGVCAAPSCSDGVLNGSESDIDCGGGSCSPCADAHLCSGDNDCLSKVCTGGYCQAPSCSDGIANDNDMGTIDCGGSCPPCDAAVPSPPSDLSNSTID